MKMGGQGTGTGATGGAPPASASSNQNSRGQQSSPDVGAAAAGAALGRLGLGGFGRKKNNDPPPQQQQAPPPSAGGDPNAQPQAGSLLEMTTTLTGFSAGPADTSKFDVPAGYKQVENATVRRAR